MGGMLGAFAGVHVAELGGAAISGALSDAGLEAGAVDELIMGCVLSAGLGQAPARQAGMKGGLGEGVPATTLNKMCGSGMKAVMTACDQLAAGTAGVVVAGGMENMSNAPYLLPSMRGGQRLGHAQAVDHMFLDGLEDAFDQGRLMGSFAEDCAERYGFTREAQDAYALESSETGVSQGRHCHCCQCIVDIGWRSRACAHAGEPRQSSGSAHPGACIGDRYACAGTSVVFHRPHTCCKQAP